MSRADRIVPLGVCSALVLLCAVGCGQKREGGAEIDPDQARRFGLTDDAADPTQRDKDEGYYLWKTKPEAEGSLAPTDPSRRKIGGPDSP